MQVLIAQLAGHLASWGEIAPNTQRLSAQTPTLSAVLGIVGACLGVDREDVDGQQALSSGYVVVIESGSDGEPMIDFCTSEHGSGGKRIPASRREELTMPKTVTVPTNREYRQGGYWRIAISSRDDARWSLTEIAEAMRFPTWSPYLGRRSCPLMLPLAPRIVHAETGAHALEMYHPVGPIGVPSSRRFIRWTEGDIDVKPQLIVTRSDDPSPRAPRAFLTRRECVMEVT